MVGLTKMTPTHTKTLVPAPKDLKGMRVLIVGLARTGIAVARFLSDQEARVVGVDIRARPDLERDFPELKELDIELRVGGHDEASFLRADLIVLSPGVPPSIEPLAKARGRGTPIFSEIELASWFMKTPITAVTGTNGKTTTTLLIGEMLRRAGKQVFVGGNIGNPLINLVAGNEKKDMAVVELSSFQLEGTERFRPAIAVLLNISEDHLDRYGRFEAYVEAKSRLFANQEASDVSVLNASDSAVLRAARASRARKIYFDMKGDRREGASFKGRHIILSGVTGKEVYDPEKSRLLGIHNIENMMAAIVVARLCGCPEDVAQQTLETFHGLPHRLEFVREVKGVRYFNDSKGTNVGAVVKSLLTFQGPIILIAGGKDKGGDYAPLREPIRERVKNLILMGEARKRMARELEKTLPITMVPSLDAAVREAYSLARPGDTVLLSPACSSYDMFRDFVERGDAFKALVKGLNPSAKGRGRVRF
jgi:UDP-N-acetylmuramoylalanine--D-glutamate ligase